MVLSPMLFIYKLKIILNYKAKQMMWRRIIKVIKIIPVWKFKGMSI